MIRVNYVKIYELWPKFHFFHELSKVCINTPTLTKKIHFFHELSKVCVNTRSLTIDQFFHDFQSTLDVADEMTLIERYYYKTKQRRMLDMSSPYVGHVITRNLKYITCRIHVNRSVARDWNRRKIDQLSKFVEKMKFQSKFMYLHKLLKVR